MYRLKQLEAMPTLRQGHTDDLKIDTGTLRVWLSRMTIADGMPYDNQVTVEAYTHPKKYGSAVTDQSKPKGWQTIQEYQAK